jgi:hypothetical protein
MKIQAVIEDQECYTPCPNHVGGNMVGSGGCQECSFYVGKVHGVCNCEILCSFDGKDGSKIPDDPIITGCDDHPAQHSRLFDFAKLINATKIEYTDLGKGEKYIMHLAGGERVTLNANGNGVDGGYLTMEM